MLFVLLFNFILALCLSLHFKALPIRGTVSLWQLRKIKIEKMCQHQSALHWKAEQPWDRNNDLWEQAIMNPEVLFAVGKTYQTGGWTLLTQFFFLIRSLLFPGCSVQPSLPPKASENSQHEPPQSCWLALTWPEAALRPNANKTQHRTKLSLQKTSPPAARCWPGRKAGSRPAGRATGPERRSRGNHHGTELAAGPARCW